MHSGRIPREKQIVNTLRKLPEHRKLKRAGLNCGHRFDITCCENLERCVRIPMRESLRSLNLSNSAAIGVYEVLRQSGFRGQQEESDYLSEA